MQVGPAMHICVNLVAPPHAADFSQTELVLGLSFLWPHPAGWGPVGLCWAEPRRARLGWVGPAGPGLRREAVRADILSMSICTIPFCLPSYPLFGGVVLSNSSPFRRGLVRVFEQW